MNESRISVRYSRALFELSLEENMLESTVSDMKMLLGISTLPEFRKFTDNPAIRPSEKIKIFHAAFDGQFNRLTFSLAELIIKNSREKYLAAIARNFISLSKKHLGITDVVLTTAVSVTNEVIGKIQSAVASAYQTKPEIQKSVDPSMIGGFVLRVEDSLFDASVKSKLKRFKRGMM